MSNTRPDVDIRFLRKDDIESIALAFREHGWEASKPASRYERYLAEQDESRRTVLVALRHDQFAGYLTVVWIPDYEPFRDRGIPEIQDFNVLPQVRRRGIGTALMDQAERMIAGRSPVAGIGVGMTADYGPAQRLYVLRGYVPDGNGLMSKRRGVEYGKEVIVDDDLVLYFEKRLTRDADRLPNPSHSPTV